MRRFLSRGLLACGLAVGALAPATGQEPTTAVWHEAQNWWRPAATSEVQRLQVGTELPVSPLSGVVDLDVRVTALHTPGYHIPELIEELDVSLDDGIGQATGLSWTPAQAAESQLVTVQLDTSHAGDGWHELNLEVSAREGTSRRFVRLVVPVLTLNGNPASAQPTIAPGASRSLAWIVRQVRGGISPSFGINQAEDSETTTDTGPVFETTFGSVHVENGGGGEPVSDNWQPRWNVQSSGIGPTFLLSFDPFRTQHDLGQIQLNEWPVVSEEFSVPLFPGGGRTPGIRAGDRRGSTWRPGGGVGVRRRCDRGVRHDRDAG